MLKKIKLALLGVVACSANFEVNAGTWYEDWIEQPIYETTYEIKYWGTASCQGQVLSVSQSQATDVKTYCLGNYHFFPFTPPSCGNNYCAASLPYQTQVATQHQTGTRKIAIQPYPSSVDIERLGCVNGARKFIVNVSGHEAASTMKIFTAGAPGYPEYQLFSGQTTASVLLSQYGTPSSLNVRVKLDDGSSYYTTLTNASCPGNGTPPRPLN
ncbi:MAG: hypothetical protein OQK51_26400 [Kangiellaceae bacterium]|nr:hypothetical protein [Kangiellaceae bacterium]